MLDISIIVPVYNRPDETHALLESLCLQTDPLFEVLIIEDGSTTPCKEVVALFNNKLQIKYFFKNNSGPGLSRNFGAEKGKGNYFIFFDSDCEIPPNYIYTVRKNLTSNYSDAYGGPDKAHALFSPMQKAINYSMTSLFTTGGIRGKKKGLEKFHPRSFNMGFSKEVIKKTQGFSKMRFGEDVDLSIRIFAAGFHVQFLEDAYVYHKRRTDFKKFFKQVYNSGIARINLYKLHPSSLKLVHFFPTLFVLGLCFTLALSFVFPFFIIPLLFFVFITFIDSYIKEKMLSVAFLSVIASLIQLIGYGTGFLAGTWNRLILKKKDFQAFNETFYD